MPDYEQETENHAGPDPGGGRPAGGPPLPPLTGAVRFVAYLIPYLVVGYDILLKAGKGIRNRQVFDECFLMAVATVGAIALAFYEGSGDYTEAIAVMLFYQIGELVPELCRGQEPPEHQRPDGHPSRLRQRGAGRPAGPGGPGRGGHRHRHRGPARREGAHLDGVVTEGTSTLDTAALTGESLPRDVTAGDEIISGCINLTGLLKIRTTKEFGESTVSKILDLVENASSRKSRSEDFISKFARVYTPAVCIAALALAVLPPAGAAGGPGPGADWGGLDLPGPDLPGDQLPLRPGDLHPPELLRRHRRGQPGRASW